MKVFVYGTLMSYTTIMHMLTKGEAVLIDKADSVEGYDLYDCGPFPCVQPGEGTVKGQVYEVPFHHIDTLDYYEGVPIHYCTQQVLTLNGHECIMYVYARKDTYLNKIESGDWLAHCEETIDNLNL